MKTIYILLIFISILFLFPKNIDALTAGSSANLLTLDVKEKDDTRSKMLKAYLEQHNSPLAEFAEEFVVEADRYNMDYRLLVAIAGVESTFGKRIPQNSYNGWGWGIYGDNSMGFDSWSDAIQTITKELRIRYIDTWGAKTVADIGNYYASDPNWANKVTHFLDDIDEFEEIQKNKTLSISI